MRLAVQFVYMCKDCLVTSGPRALPELDLHGLDTVCNFNKCNSVHRVRKLHGTS